MNSVHRLTCASTAVSFFHRGIFICKHRKHSEKMHSFDTVVSEGICPYPWEKAMQPMPTSETSMSRSILVFQFTYFSIPFPPVLSKSVPDHPPAPLRRNDRHRQTSFANRSSSVQEYTDKYCSNRTIHQRGADNCNRRFCSHCHIFV